MKISIPGGQNMPAFDNEEKTMRRRLTVGFFFGFLAISLFGCSANSSSSSSSDTTSPNRPQLFTVLKISK